MNIQQLRYAAEVEKTGSISRAAENLFMGQPHLSKAVRELEEDMNITIFKRTPKGAEPTLQGREFLEYARRILAQIDELEAMYKPSGARRFSLSLPRASYAAHAFTLFMQELRDDEGLDIRYHETNSIDTIKSVGEGTADLGIVRFQRSHDKYFLSMLEERAISWETIWDFNFVALMSTKNPLAEKELVSYAELRHQTEIVHDDNSVPAMPVSESMLQAQTHEKKKKIAVYERGIQFELLCRLPQSYIWVSPMPAETLSTYGLVQKRCPEADNAFRDILISRKNYKLSAEDQAFIEKLRLVTEELKSR
mgnify:CR=1 FL=1